MEDVKYNTLTFLGSFFYEFWIVVRESAVWLLIGFLIAGIIHKYISINFVKKHLSQKKTLSIFKSTLLGIPLPLCSCSIIPVSKSLHQSGASKGSTAAFMVSTPEIGVDSFFLTKALLGLPLAILRVIAAFTSACISGALVDKFSNEVDNSIKPPVNTDHCCQSRAETILNEKRNREVEKKSLLYFAFVELPNDLSKPLLWGFTISALVSTILPNDFITTHVQNPYLQMLFALFVSIPIYVCASSSTPIVASLLTKGLVPGAAVVLLLAGPATNSSTILAAKQMFGGKGAICYSFGIIITAIAFGLLAQNLFPNLGQEVLTLQGHKHSHVSLIHNLAAIIILLLLTGRFYSQRIKSLF